VNPNLDVFGEAGEVDFMLDPSLLVPGQDPSFACDINVSWDPYDNTSDGGILNIHKTTNGVVDTLSGSKIIVNPNGSLNFVDYSTKTQTCSLFCQTGLTIWPQLKVNGGVLSDQATGGSPSRPTYCQPNLWITYNGSMIVNASDSFDENGPLASTVDWGHINLWGPCTANFDNGLSINGANHVPQTYLTVSGGNGQAIVNMTTDNTNGLSLQNCTLNMGNGGADYPQFDVTGLVTVGSTCQTNVNTYSGSGSSGPLITHVFYCSELNVTGVCNIQGGPVNLNGNGTPQQGDVYQFVKDYATSGTGLNGEFATPTYTGALAGLNDLVYSWQTGPLGYIEVYLS
jgi:hypothetical protein